jgi:hypothetical protein
VVRAEHVRYQLDAQADAVDDHEPGEVVGGQALLPVVVTVPSALFSEGR